VSAHGTGASTGAATGTAACALQRLYLPLGAMWWQIIVQRHDIRLQREKMLCTKQHVREARCLVQAVCAGGFTAAGTGAGAATTLQRLQLPREEVWWRSTLQWPHML
jgi:hypothetical protein